MRGFTLIEVLLALAIFTIIGIATVKQIQLIANTKDEALTELDFYNEIRSVLSLMRGDLGQAFHVLYDDLGEETKSQVIQNQKVPHTLFDGRKSELIFTSLSHRVYYSGVRESEQTEISYFLYQANKKEMPSLIKRESELIDSDLYLGGTLSALIDRVQTLEFSYWDDRQQKWIDEWNSDNADTRDRFPHAVKVKLVVPGRNQKLITIETQMKLAFPNNQPLLAQF